jgi:hypothetical protein
MSDPRPDGQGDARVRMKIVRMPPGLALVLALPVVLVAGAVAVATLAAGVVALLFAPARVRRAERRDDADGGVTITLDPSAYQTVSPDGTPSGDHEHRKLIAREP